LTDAVADWEALGGVGEAARALAAGAPRGTGTLRLLRPRFLARAVYDDVCARARIVQRAVQVCVERLLADPELRRRACRFPPAFDARIAEEAALPDTAPVRRFDGVLDQELRFLELNGSSGGIFKSARLAARFRELGAARAFRERWRVTDFDLAARFHDAICAVSRRLGHEGPLRLGVIDARGLAEDPSGEGELMCRELAARGAAVTVGDWSQLALDGATLRLAGAPVTCLAFYAREPGDYDLVARARRAGAAWTLVGMRDLVANSKAIPALLTDPDSGLHDPEAARHLPWTRVLVDELVPLALERRERLVLKPANASGGRGVVLGWDTEPARWAALVDQARRASYVVQERVELPVETFPLPDGPAPLHVDLGPLLWADGRVEGAFVRATRTGRMSLSGDAGTTPLWVIEPREWPAGTRRGSAGRGSGAPPSRRGRAG
jgi:hypothetical protein